MHPAISQFPNNYFYNSSILDAKGLAASRVGDLNEYCYHQQYRFFNINAGTSSSS
jgi:superfamily I DNA and/or RNA helicase